jgi:GR25 family glycosyltransferase involved in LPS biosynthesis
MKCFFVNLDTRPDRCAQMEHELKKIPNIPWDRFSAIQGDNDTLLQLCDSESISTVNYLRVLSEANAFLTRGAIGCFLSHLRLYQYSVDHDEILIIFEDDVIIHNEFEKIVLDGLESINYQFNIIYLGQPMNQWISSSKEFNHFWQIEDGYHGTFGYMIHPTYSQFLLHHLHKIENHIDNTILQLNKMYRKTVLLFKTVLVNTDASPARNSNVMLNVRSIRSKSYLIPLVIYILNNGSIPNIKRYNPKFSIRVKNSKTEIENEIKEKGGFFLDIKASFRASIQDVIHNADYISIHHYKHLFYGESIHKCGKPLLLSHKLFVINENDVDNQ